MQDQAIKWYFKTNMIIIGFLCFGPLVLPLVWLNPSFSTRKKTIATLIIVAISYILGIALVNSLRSISSYYDQIFQLLNG